MQIFLAYFDCIVQYQTGSINNSAYVIKCTSTYIINYKVSLVPFSKIFMNIRVFIIHNHKTFIYRVIKILCRYILRVNSYTANLRT